MILHMALYIIKLGTTAHSSRLSSLGKSLSLQSQLINMKEETASSNVKTFTQSYKDQEESGKQHQQRNIVVFW